MAPKKKSNKKGNDDWDAELGESVDPIPAASPEAKESETSNEAQEDERAGGGGLLAAIQKNRSKKQKKSGVVEDPVEDGPGVETNGNTDDGTNGQIELAAKAPEEATADDLFAMGPAKGKGGKGGKQWKEKEEDKVGDEEDEEDDGSKMKTKKEKEKERKEREKQRKKEQVCTELLVGFMHQLLNCVLRYTGCEEKGTGVGSSCKSGSSSTSSKTGSCRASISTRFEQGW